MYRNLMLIGAGSLLLIVLTGCASPDSMVVKPRRETLEAIPSMAEHLATKHRRTGLFEDSSGVMWDSRMVSEVHSGEYFHYTYLQYLNSVLQNGQEVSIFVYLPSDAFHVELDPDSGYVRTKTDREQMIAAEGRDLIDTLGAFDGFRLVDRRRTERLAQEFELSLSGLIESKGVVEVGQMLGANYMLDIIKEYTVGVLQYPGNDDLNDWFKERTIYRLIDVQSGQIEALDTKIWSYYLRRADGAHVNYEFLLNERNVVIDPLDEELYFE